MARSKYQPLHEFETSAVRWAFSDAIIRAVLAYDAKALESREGAVA